MLRRRLPRPRIAFATAAAAAITFAACSDSTTEPASIAGTYNATTFRVTPTGTAPIDVLAEGGTMTVTISPSNATTGALYIPASLNGGEPITYDMAGTAVRTGNSVRFTQAGGTPVRDIPFTVSGNTLQGTASLGNAGITVVLTRQ